MLLLLFVTDVISLSLLFLMYFSCYYGDASTQSAMLAGPLPFFFLDTSLAVSSPESKAFCIVINFHVLWFVRLNSSLVSFKNRLGYLTKVGGCPAVYPLDEIAGEHGFKKFPCSFEKLFSHFFFHLNFFDGIRFEYSQNIIIFIIINNNTNNKNNNNNTSSVFLGNLLSLFLFEVCLTSRAAINRK